MPAKRADEANSPVANKFDFALFFTDDIVFCIKLPSDGVAFLPFDCFCNLSSCANISSSKASVSYCFIVCSCTITFVTSLI